MMTNRERYHNTFHFKPVDHPPLIVPGSWPSTRKRWEREGLPKGVDLYDYFKLPPFKMRHIGIETVLYPPFEEKILERTEEYVIKINHNGAKVKNFKDEDSMPEFLEYPIKGPESLGWLREKLDPATPGRIKAGWLEEAERMRANDELVFCNGGMYFGFINERMGSEALLMAYYDTPDLIHEVNELQCRLSEQALKLSLSKFKLDAIGYHEDMAYKNGSMISMDMFKEFMLPYYKRSVKIAHEHGIDIHWLDCDGNIYELIPLWLDCGINCLLPLEVAAGMDVPRLRKEYGHRLLMIGGFDKRILAAGKPEIKRELERLRPVMEEGGYIPEIDHGVPPDVSWENLCYYVETLKGIYGIT